MARSTPTSMHGKILLWHAEGLALSGVAGDGNTLKGWQTSRSLMIGPKAYRRRKRGLFE
jgi:hypothetical protein